MTNIYIIAQYREIDKMKNDKCKLPRKSASTTVYTMVEMAKAHGLNVEKYLTFLLEKRPHAGMTDEDLAKLTPWSENARVYCGFAQQIAFT